MKKTLGKHGPFVAPLVGLGVLAMIGFLPLFAGPGYESSLASGLVLPVSIAIGAALVMARAPKIQPFDALSRGISMGALVALLGYATTLAHGLRTGFCDLLGGTVFYALGPAVGCLLAGAWGAFAGELAAKISSKYRGIVAVALAILAPLAGILVSLGRFYSSPIIFAFDPFVGFFSGALYDTVVDDALFALSTYRIGSALTLLACTIAALHLRKDDAGRYRSSWLGRPWLVVIGIACAFGSLFIAWQGPKLGHHQTAKTIEEALGGQLAGDRCDIVYSRSLGIEEARLFARDCDAQVEAVERFMGVEKTPRIRAYLFRDPTEKRRLMGAANTYIAKPWRHEVYLQAAGFPHPVLGHEIAHIVAGSFTTGPFRVGGSLWGLRSNPGLVEGIAVAASPDDDDDLTPAEWSRAMLELGILPKLERVFALGFFWETSAKSYTVAGAFVAFVHDRYGAEAMRNWYAGEAIEKITGQSLSGLEPEWHDHLRSLSISPHARAVAEARFDRPSVFGRACPHEVDGLRGEASLAQSAGDFVLAKASYEKLLRLDPHDVRARFQLAACHLRSGDREAALMDLESLAEDEKKPRAVRDRALERLADLSLQEGALERAQRLYEELRSRVLDEDAKRTLDVKLEAIRNEEAREPIVAFLLGTKERGVDAISAASKLGAWAASAPNDGLPDYLLARGLVGRGLYPEGIAGLERALEKGLTIASVRKEALRLRIVAACAVDEREGVVRAYAAWRAEAETGGARGEGVRRLVERCGGGA